MQIKVKTIRNLEVIEKELNSISAGVFLLSKNDDFSQFASSFVYYNTNIYFFIQDTDTIKNIDLDSKARFIAIKEKGLVGKSPDKESNIYTVTSISVNGVLKQVEEKKIKNNIKQSFIQKYSGRLIESGLKSKSFKKLFYIDSEELLATEESGS